jgi:hypothetical protein
MSRILLTTALVLAWPAWAQADPGCSGSPCVRQDVEIAPADAGRTVIAVDPADASRLALTHRVDYETCDTRTMVHWSEDKGATWQSKCTMWGVWDDERTLQSPALAFDRHGVLLTVQPLYWAAPGGYLRASRLDPQTHDWDGWYYVASTRYEQGVLLNNRVQVDASPASPRRGTVYASFTEDAWDRAQIRVARSANNGRHWDVADATPPAFGNEMLDFSDLAIGRDGSLYLSYLNCVGVNRDCHGQPARLRFVRSVDGGLTWSKPTLLASTMLPPDPLPLHWLAVYGALPGTQSTLSFTPAIAIDATEGPHQDRLYSVMTTYRNERLQVLLTTSDDRGASWSPPRPVATGPHAADQFMPAISVSRQGVVAVTWMDQRRHPKETAFRPLVAFSTDGGESFSAPAPLQREASQPEAIGDLSGIASHAWAGSRLKTIFLGPDANGATTARLGTAKP